MSESDGKKRSKSVLKRGNFFVVNWFFALCNAVLAVWRVGGGGD